jgi:uncharacterized protein YggE
MSRITKLLSVALLAVFAVACSAAEAAPVPQTQALPRTITVIGEGTVRLRPDVAKMNVGVEARANTVSEAKEQVDEQMGAIMSALADVGVDQADVQTSHYGIYYERESGPTPADGQSTEMNGGYLVSNLVLVTIRDVDTAGDVLDAVVQAGANQVNGVTFTVSDESAWQSQAREKAMADARSRAEELAVLSGAELGEIQSVSEVVGGLAAPMMAVERGMGGGGMTPGELELGTQIQVVFGIQ